MSDHADIVRALLTSNKPITDARPALAALDALVAERDRLREALQLIAKPGVQSTNPRHVARAALAAPHNTQDGGS